MALKKNRQMLKKIIDFFENPQHQEIKIKNRFSLNPKTQSKISYYTRTQTQ